VIRLKEKITILIPCYNEENGVGKVISRIPTERLRRLGYGLEIIVIDNNSIDATASVALDAGAKVIKEERQGKGFALRKGFESISDDTTIVVMIDGDNTYDINEIFRLVEPISNGFCDVVIGSRLNGKIMDKSMTNLNRAGNWALTFLVRTSYLANVTDVCTGFFAWSRKSIDILRPYLSSSDFTVEMEMITKLAKLGFEIYSVPITYNSRIGTSSLHPIKDGAKIFGIWFNNLFWSPYGETDHINSNTEELSAEDE
jgi:dolichol-phosphate hexosyltransferase